MKHQQRRSKAIEEAYCELIKKLRHYNNTEGMKTTMKEAFSHLIDKGFVNMEQGEELSKLQSLLNLTNIEHTVMTYPDYSVVVLDENLPC
ncbi:hypothetical protein CEW46_27470 [Bacillus cereus]|nr:hypothetical protein CEW46_27470 [Bacillus cereus]